MKWSNLAQVVYYRTYSRNDTGKQENWNDTVDRVIKGNTRNFKVSGSELKTLEYLMRNRKAGPAGRGLWFSGAPAHDKLGGAALNNCYFTTAEEWQNFVMAQDLLMLGGGVGLSVEHRFTSKLPFVKRDIAILHKETKDADFIVPDSREGWNELVRRVLESYFVTGKSFSFSTVCIRPAGDGIKGFGGKASGPGPLVTLVAKIVAILNQRAGKKVRPLDALDILCSIGEMVVSGNVRRSAIIILGDPWDKEYLKAKRWDLGPVPNQRAMANLSVVVDDVEDLHPLFWKTYEHGEPYGIVNRTNIQKYGRMGELKHDSAIGVNPCVPGETEILTRNGYFRIDSLIGKKVDVWNGFEWSEVQPRITGTNQEMVQVNLSSGQSLVCTKAHTFWVAEGYTGQSHAVEASDLESGMKLIKTSMPVVEEGADFKHAYAQGFISGDGMDGYNYLWLYSPKFMCENRLGGIVGLEHAGRKTVRPGFDHLPKSFVPMGWNVSSRLNWLAGLFDSDGTELKEGGAQVASVDRPFLLKVQKMLTTLGVTSKVALGSVAKIKPMPDGKGGIRDFPCQEIYRLLVGAVQIQDLKKLGLKCERLIFDKSPQRDASQFVTVVDVVDAGNEETVYCFTEPKRHLGCFEGVVTGQCGEATLEGGPLVAEPCNLQEMALPNIEDEEEFVMAARLMHRYGKRVTMEAYHWKGLEEVVHRNRRVGTGITGCLQSDLFTPRVLDLAYAAIQDENRKYSKELGIPESVRTTVVKPSGTMSKVMDMRGFEGIHPAFSRHYIQRVRFSANDPLVPMLQLAGHHVEPVVKFDNSIDPSTVVVDFYEQAPKGSPVADEEWTTWKQLDTLMTAQKHWADQAVSVTVYYRKEELAQVKAWLAENLSNIKTISFLCHNDHGFKQAPKEAISKDVFEALSEKIKPVKIDTDVGSDKTLDGTECESGFCPVK